MPQSLLLRLAGLQTYSNYFSEAEPGALRVASGVVLDRAGVLQSRRGAKPYGTALASSVSRINRLFEYRGTLLAQYDSAIAYDSDDAGTWVDYSGTFEALTGHKVRAAQAGGNIYFTTNEGLQRLDAIAGSPAPAGVVRALSGSATLSGSSGFMATNTQVAYRVAWVFTDAQGVEHVGAPSGRIVIANASGGTRDVALTLSIPSAITTDYVYRLYRSGASASSSAEPTDELQLVREATPTSAEVAAGALSYTDAVPDSLRGEALYTGPDQEGIAAANDRPPISADVCQFAQHMFYGDIQREQRLEVTLVSAGVATTGAGVRYVVLAGDVASGSPIITNISSTAALRAGMRASGTGLPNTARVLSVDSGTQVTLTVNATATNAGVSITWADVVTIDGREYFAAAAQNVGNHEFLAASAGTPSQNVADTANSLIAVVNGDTGNAVLYAYYDSGFNELPGRVVLEERGLGGASFEVSASAGAAFVPPLFTAVESDTGRLSHAVAISKESEFEAVPRANFYPIGVAGRAVLRVVALRDSVLVFKEDGLYRITGDGFDNWTIWTVDETYRLRGLETPALLDNEVYAMTSKGVLAVGEGAGVRPVGGDVEGELFRLSSDAFTGFDELASGWAYEADNKYYLAVPRVASDVQPQQVLALNVKTGQWTTPFVAPRSCGLVLDRDGRMYMGAPTLARVTQERKAFTRYDYADSELAVDIASATGTAITLTSTTGITPGWTLVQGLTESVILSVDSTTELTVTDEREWNAGAALAVEPISVQFELVPLAAGNPGVVKQWRECTVLFDSATFDSAELRFSNNFDAVFQPVRLSAAQTGAAWGGVPWGEGIWGEGAAAERTIRTLVPLEMQRAHWLVVGFRASQAYSNFAILGLSLLFEGGSERFKGGGSELTQDVQ